MSVTCPYCGEQAPLTHTREIYGRDYGWAYRCVPCGAYVGCHSGTTKAKGSPANYALREARKAAHRAFDPTWLYRNQTRPEAYKWLAGKMKIDVKKCHIGMFNDEQCRAAIEICRYRS